MVTKKSLILLLSVFTLAVVGFIYQIYNIRGKPVFEIGDYQFSQSDIDVAEAVEKFNYPHAPLGQGKRQLSKAALYGMLLKKLGHPITEADLDAELQRIEMTTLMPGNWMKLKSLALNRESLKKNIVFPILVFRKLPMDIFPRSSQIHQQRKLEAEAMFQKIRNKSISWSELIRTEKNLSTCVSWNQNEKEYQEDPQCRQGFKPPKDSETPTSSPIPDFLKDKMNSKNQRESLGVIWTKQMAAKIKVGDIFPVLVETSDSYLIVRIEEMKSNGKFINFAKYSFFRIKKIVFEEWMEQESKDIKVRTL